MCAPVAIGIATAVVGAVGAVGQYVQQQQQVDYSNAQAQAQADYQNKVALFQAQQNNQQIAFSNQNLMMQSFNQRNAIANQNLQTQNEFLAQQQQRQYQTLQNQLEFQTELNKSLASQAFVNSQLELNKNATSRAIQAEQQKLADAQAQAAFEGQRLLATNLQTQGSVLSSGRSGQSIGLLVNDAERTYGQNAAILNRNSQTATGDYLNNSAMAVLRQLNADVDASNRLIPEPIRPLPLPELPKPVFADLPDYAPMQPFQTSAGPMATPVFASGPSGIGLVAGIGGSMLGGYNAYSQAKALVPPPPSSTVIP
jgi:hypothetical protein